jgi:hypothetical protein
MAQDVIWVGTGVLVEQVNSPQWTFAEKVSATQIFRGQYAMARASAAPRGALGLGEFAGMRVASSTVVPERGRIGTLTITYEGPPEADDGSQLPADECAIDYQQQEFDIRSHPTFASLTKEDFWGIDAFLNSSDFQTEEFLSWLSTGATAPKIDELLQRLQRQQDKFVMYPPIYRTTSFFLDEPFADGGGYIDYPFGLLTVPANFSWLRAGDTVNFNGTYWQLTRSWVGAGGAGWDTLIYG